MSGPANSTMIHCGLFGHVDSGKTAVAAMLSKVVSTAGLDAHPQAKRRGISIDLGFTSFDVDGFRVALVDAPGHADLIRSVVASASIIDVALVVIDAGKGPELQTGEHMVILDALGIKHVVFILNKIDTLAAADIPVKVAAISSFAAASGPAFARAPVVPVSVRNRVGLGALLATLRDVLAAVKPVRDQTAPFLMAFDHHFPVKGFGTVLTGTVLSGTARPGDVLDIVPAGQAGKVKSIHVFKEPVDAARAGDRAGIAVAGIDDGRLFRGCVLATPGSISSARDVIVAGSTTAFFKHPLAFKSQVHVTVGMLTVPATILPYREEGSYLVPVETIQPRSGTFTAWIRLHEPVPCKVGFVLLVSRLDLPPVELRVAARGTVARLPGEPLVFHVFKEKAGKVKDAAKGVVEGLARSHEGAIRIAGRDVSCTVVEGGNAVTIHGKVAEPFGTKGNVRVAFDDPGARVVTGAPVRMVVPRALHLSLP